MSLNELLIGDYSTKPWSAIKVHSIQCGDAEFNGNVDLKDANLDLDTGTITAAEGVFDILEAKSIDVKNSDTFAAVVLQGSADPNGYRIYSNGADTGICMQDVQALTDIACFHEDAVEIYRQLDPQLGIVGVDAKSDAAAGFIGEYKETYDAAGWTIGATGAFANLSSLSLTAGDWDVDLVVNIQCADQKVNGAVVGISNDPVATTFTDEKDGSNASAVGGSGADILRQNECLNVSSYRISLGATTTYYLKAALIYTGVTPQVRARMSARRRR